MRIRAIDSTWTVNDIIRRFPTTIPVFNAYGIDSCCGGAASLEEAARRHGLDLDALASALEEAVEASEATGVGGSS